MEKRNLPWDFIEEILSRVLAKSLVRLGSTSKQWNALLKSGSFAKKHSANAPKESLTIMLCARRVNLVRINLHGIHNDVAPSVKIATRFYLKDPFSYSSQVEIGRIFHCDGLLLCTTKNNRLVVWNPCSGETRWIQPRDTYEESDKYALGYDNKSSCKKYKILRVYLRHDNYEINNAHEIYDFTSDSWRVLGASKDWSFAATASHRAVSMKGNAYWVALDTTQFDKPCFLLSFDFSTEKFRKLSLPRTFSYRIVALSGFREEQLCLLGTYCIGEESDLSNLHVWVTTSIGSVISWSKFVTVKTNFERRWGEFLSFFDGVSFLADEQNKVVVCCNQHTVNNKFSHILGENKLIRVYPHAGDSYTFGEKTNSYMSSSPVLLDYVPSLAQIQQGFYQKKKKIQQGSLPRGCKRKVPSM